MNDGSIYLRIPIVDLAAASNAALAIVAALMQRERTGDGVYIDMALLDAAVAWSLVKVPESGRANEPAYGVYLTRDKRRVAVSVMEDEMWKRLCAALDWRDWAEEPRLERHAARKALAEEVHRRLTDELGRRTGDEVLALARAHDLAITPVNDDVAGALNGAPVVDRAICSKDGAWAPLGPAVGRVPYAELRAVGADTVDVLKAHGFDPDEIVALADAGAFPGWQPAVGGKAPDLSGP